MCDMSHLGHSYLSSEAAFKLRPLPLIFDLAYNKVKACYSKPSTMLILSLPCCLDFLA